LLYVVQKDFFFLATFLEALIVYLQKFLIQMNSIVAIVGRPNVGKSTLFNRLVQRREAIVDSVSGVTRDRHYGKSDWNGKEFSVIDTWWDTLWALMISLKEKLENK
jgi:tRNA U34 5-carboxymethylaminomethyl modifying GTPase MnmE/TrmE